MGKHRHPDDARRRRRAPIHPAPPSPRVGPWMVGFAVAGTVVSGVAVAVAPQVSAPDSLPQPVASALTLLPPVSAEEIGTHLAEAAASRAAREHEKDAAIEVQAAAEEVAAQAAQEAAEAPTPTPVTPEPSHAAEDATETVPSGLPAVAQITNSAGPVHPNVQAAADAVVANVPGAGSITLGGTRSSAIDPAGHPSGLALDYMVGSNSALGDAIVAYHVANWDALGVDYIIWEQRLLTSPAGSWSLMEDRGGATANHMDHPHVNYRG